MINKKQPLIAWFLFLFFITITCLLLAARESFFILIPPALALSLTLPILHQFFSNPPKILIKLEPVFVMLLIALWGYALFALIFKKHLLINTADHQMMIARAEEFMQGLKKGHWQHWSHAYQGGDSLVDLYPIIGTLLTILLNFFSPHNTSIATSYTHMILFMWWLRGIAVYFLARRFSHPAISLLLAFTALLDVGYRGWEGIWDGGWNSGFFWGLLCSHFALSFGALALAFQIDLIKKTITTSRILLCTFFTALTIFSHPLGLLFILISQASFLLFFLFKNSSWKEPFWALTSSFLGLLLISFWALPFFHALKTWGYSFAIAGMDLTTLGHGLLMGNFPLTSFAAYVGLAFIAVMASLTSSQPALSFTAFATLIFWMLAIPPIFIQTHLFEYFSSFLDGQPRRMLSVLRILAIPSLAWILNLAFQHLKKRPSLEMRPVILRSIILIFIFIGPGRALTAALIELSDQLRAQAISTLPGEREPTHALPPDHREIFQWIEQRRREDTRPVEWRIALNWIMTGWRHASWVQGLRNHIPVADFSYVTANFLDNRPREKTLEGCRDWNIRYIITDHPNPPIPEATLQFTSNTLRVWEIPLDDPQEFVVPAGITTTPLIKEGDRMSFHLEGAPESGVDVLIRTAWFTRWQAFENGKPLALTPSPPRVNAKPKQDQILIHAYNGDILLTCDGPMPRFYWGCFLTLMGICFTLVVVSEKRRKKIEILLQKIIEKKLVFIKKNQKPLSISLAGLLLFFSFILWYRGSPKLILPPLEGYHLDISLKNRFNIFESCSAEWWRGRYVCPNEKAIIDAWQGSSALHGNNENDDSGESHPQWPGTRLWMPQAGTTVEMKFSRIHLKELLTLKVATGGRFRVTGWAGKNRLFERFYEGEIIDPLSLKDISSENSIRLQIESTTPHSFIIFRGDF